jgi:hypothetical protein
MRQKSAISNTMHHNGKRHRQTEGACTIFVPTFAPGFGAVCSERRRVDRRGVRLAALPTLARRPRAPLGTEAAFSGGDRSQQSLWRRKARRAEALQKAKNRRTY